MRALVISGGGSKGAFAGGVAQYLINIKEYDYDILVGTSTGSLLVSHLALKKVEKIKSIYTSVNQNSIFNISPFIIKTDKTGNKQIGINHFNVLRSFIKKQKTFGESKRLKKLIDYNFTEEEFQQLRNLKKEIVVTVSNLTKNQVEYKSIRDCSYKDFCDWIWISANFIPFMSLATKNGCEYADGGFGNLVPIEEAINRGATTIDVIVLQTEDINSIRPVSKNAFSLMGNIHSFMTDRIERQNIHIGKLVANSKHVTLNFYYTPTVLTNNSLIFDQELMTQWWESGYQYAKNKNDNFCSI